MKLYHSSNVEVRNVDTLHSRDFLDFGKVSISPQFWSRH